MADLLQSSIAQRRNGKSAAAFRTISEVADDLEVPPHVLRFWETKFNQVRPLKRGGGRRYYRPEDVALLQRIRELLYREGYTIKGVKKLLRDGAVRMPTAGVAAGLRVPAGRPAVVEDQVHSGPAGEPRRGPPVLSPRGRRPAAAHTRAAVSRRLHDQGGPEAAARRCGADADRRRDGPGGAIGQPGEGRHRACAGSPAGGRRPARGRSQDRAPIAAPGVEGAGAQAGWRAVLSRDSRPFGGPVTG